MASTSRIPSQRGFDSWITLVQCFLLQYSMVPTTRRVIMQKRNLYMCVGFALDHSRAVATKGFKIVCILEIHTTYAFEISDGNSWRFSETIITTTSSKSELTKQMKPVYLEGTLHWLRNDGSIIAFNIETEKACFIPSVFHPEPEMKMLFTLDVKINRMTLISGTKETISVYTLTGDHTSKWALARQIENVLMTESEFEYWNIKKKDSSTGVARVYNMEDNSWGAWWETLCQAKYNLDLFRLDLKSLVMMQCTNKSIRSHISDDPSFEIGYSSRVRLSFLYTFSKGAPFVFYQPFGSQCESMSNVKTFASLQGIHCYILGSCSGHLLLYTNGLYVVNPLTKRFRLLDHSGSMLLATIFNGPNNKANNTEERAMCVGFALDQSRATTTKRFKIICILETHTTYAFEISDGNSWRFSETIITTTNSKSELTKRMKPVYLEGTLHWLRNDGSIIAFNIETEQARFIPSVFHPEPEMKLLFTLDDKINRLTLISGTKNTISVYTLTGDHTSKWALARQIENVLMTESEFEYWNVVAYDGKHMVVRDKEKDGSTGVAHVYNMEDNRWGAWWPTACQAKYNLDVFRFTPFFSFFEHTEVVEDSTNEHLARIMRLIDTTKRIDKLFLMLALAYDK
ncbi:unnamed protein product [Brassica rapa subsp. trilocularis]